MPNDRETWTRSGLRDVATIVGVTLAYFLAARFGLSLAFTTRQVTAVWPPTGIAFAAYLLFGYRVWPGVFLGAFWVNAISNEPLLTAAGVAVGNTLAGIVGLCLLRRFVDLDKRLQRLRDVLGLVCFGAAIGCTVSATNGVANLALGGIVPWSSYGSVWWVWWAGDALGVLLVSPFLLTWIAQPRFSWRGRRLLEFTALFLALAVVSYVSLSGQLAQTNTLFRLEYTVFPFVIWAALRFGQREAATAVALISSAAIWGAIHERGPFALGTLDQRLVLLGVFMAATAVAALTLGAVTAERRNAERALEHARDELEARVHERTAELAAANRELARRNEEVEAFVYIVSHDLRGPLVNLQGFSKELDTSCRELQEKLHTATPGRDMEESIRAILEQDIPGSLRFISASTTKFQRLIDALLTLSRYGRQEYRSEDIDVDALVGATLDSLKQSIDRAGAKVSVNALPTATGDATAIGQVFSNLIVNAVNFLRPGRPGLIEIGGEKEDTSSHYWVRDNGAGIPASAGRRIFQVFQRFHPELAQGEGMGLAIVKRIVERHGGKVWMESQVGVGTTFHLTLPRPVFEKGW
jgi:signal transduction histidine kinase